MSERKKYRQPWIQTGINPGGYIGAAYSVPCLALSKTDPRPMITLQLFFCVVWIKLPWKHHDNEPGWTIGRRWGAVFSPTRDYRWIGWGKR